MKSRRPAGFRSYWAANCFPPEPVFLCGNGTWNRSRLGIGSETSTWHPVGGKSSVYKIFRRHWHTRVSYCDEMTMWNWLKVWLISWRASPIRSVFLSLPDSLTHSFFLPSIYLPSLLTNKFCLMRAVDKVRPLFKQAGISCSEPLCATLCIFISDWLLRERLSAPSTGSLSLSLTSHHIRSVIRGQFLMNNQNLLPVWISQCVCKYTCEHTDDGWMIIHTQIDR